MGSENYVRHIGDNKPTVVQILEGYVPASGNDGSPKRINVDDVILKGFGADNHFSLIASRLELSRTLKNPTGKERRLARAIAQVNEQYDLIIIDCAPTESILTNAAYFASRYVVVPVKPEFMATIGLPLLAKSIREFNLEHDDHELEIAGLVVNEQSDYATYNEKTHAIREIRDLAGKHGWQIFDYQIPYSRSYPKAAREALPLSKTSGVQWDRIEGFRGIKDDILAVVGVAE